MTEIHFSFWDDLGGNRDLTGKIPASAQTKKAKHIRRHARLS
jgi:hypothetical protein